MSVLALATDACRRFVRDGKLFDWSEVRYVRSGCDPVHPHLRGRSEGTATVHVADRSGTDQQVGQQPVRIT